MADERLIVSLEARIRDFERNMQRASRTATSQFTAIERRAAQSSKNLERTLGGAGRQIAGIFAAGASVQGAQKLLDSATRIENALKVAGLAGAELKAVYDNLFASAQKNAAPLESLVELYSRAALSAKDLGISQGELLRFTDGVATALRVNGKSAAESSGALLQLSQALGAGVVRAEEFNSVQEGALPILQAVAKGLKEAGGNVSTLRKLVNEGKVSSVAFFRAFEAGASTLDGKVADAQSTIAQAFTRLENVLTDVAGEMNKTTGAGVRLADFLSNDLPAALTEVAAIFTAVANGPIGKFLGLINQTTDAVVGLAAEFGRLTGLDNVGKSLGEKPYQSDFFKAATAAEIKAQIAVLEKRLEGARAVIGSAIVNELDSQIDELYEQLARVEGGGPSTRGGRRAVKAPVSIEDPGLKVDGKGDSKKRRRQDDYASETQQIIAHTAALVAETEAQRQLNPLINDYGYAVEKARATRELLTAAEEAGKTVTPALRTEIENLAEQYAVATVEAAQLAEAQGKMLDDMEFRKGVMGDALTDLRSALADGKLEFKELGDIALSVLDKIIDKIQNELLDALFKMNGGGGGTGILGSIVGAIFGGVRGGGGSDPWAGMRLPGMADGGPVGTIFSTMKPEKLA